MANGKHAKPTESNTVLRVSAVSAVAVMGAVPVSVLAAGSASAAPVGAWDCIAQYESGSVWNLSYGDATSTGGLQIQTPTWDDYGGQVYAPEAYQATKQQQIMIAEKILHGQGPTAWATNGMCGFILQRSGPDASYLDGGINPYPNGGGGSVTPPPAPAPAPQPAPVPAPVVPSSGGGSGEQEDNSPAPAATPTDSAGIYVVQPGDCLSMIAESHGLGDWHGLYEGNRHVVGDNPDLIFPGQVLVL